MSIQGAGADSREAVDLTRPIPPFMVPGLWVTFSLIALALLLRDRAFFLWPLAWAAAAATVVVVVLRRGSAVSRRLGPSAKPVGALVVAAVLMGTGGIAYTYGGYGDLSFLATAQANPLELTDGANHTVLFQLRNVGWTPVRILPIFRLAIENSSGDPMSRDHGCPPSPPGRQYPSSDGSGEVLAPGGSIDFPLVLQSDGVHLPYPRSCDTWPVKAGETYLVYAVIDGYAGTVTLPVWTGSVESNRIAVVA